MTDSGASFNRPYKPFGLNVKVPERTLKQERILVFRTPNHLQMFSKLT